MSDYTVAVIGNPNAGKTTLFNALTGLRQEVGNWPGVTVEKKSGRFAHDATTIELIDLPGAYALNAATEGLPVDERIARDYALDGEADAILNIVDASNIERNLYLTVQLLELGRPVVVALNMIDVARSWDIAVDAEVLARRLGCPVVPLVATRGEGVEALRTALTAACREARRPSLELRFEPAVERAISGLVERGAAPTRDAAVRLLEADAGLAEARAVDAAVGADPDIVVAGDRYRFIAKAVEAAVHRTTAAHQRLSDKIDRVVLHRALGIPIFLVSMYALFMLTINVGGAFIDFFDILGSTLLVDGTAHLLAGLGAPDAVITLVADGVGGGLTTVATFIPIIGCLFLLLSLLEDSGYMARAAFVMDRFLRGIGLPGKAFVPMIIGFGCTIPAVMATRTLEHARDRIIAVMMAPFMSCGARLPVYALFAAAFFPAGGQNLVFGLYLAGIAAAVATGLMLRRTILPGPSAPFVMELPPYRLPSLGGLLRRTWERLWSFIDGAGRVIVAVVVVITFLNAWGTDGSFDNADTDDSVLAAIGRTITPAFAPMGIADDNWPATVGLFTGVLAKEAVVGTLDALYTDVARDAAPDEAAPALDLAGGVSAAFASVPANLAGLGALAGDPVAMAAARDDAAASAGSFGAMQARFDGQVGAVAYLLFVLL
ncbi:MAG: Fe(2+) transporter permease subunit FeoB, partial [Alphaproteobacteria bacterium]|nr:Fe(2+) transporter permease subunit FeoB [Alphaproteobacteria bacterium]